MRCIHCHSWWVYWGVDCGNLPLPVPHCQHHYHYCHQMQPVLALFCEVSRLDDGRATTNLHRARVTCVPSLHSQTQQLQTNPTQQTQSPASAAVLIIDTHTSSRKVKPTWILLEQETVSGSSSREITTLAPHCSVTFLQAGCPSCRPTTSVKALGIYIWGNYQNRTSPWYDWC